MHSPSNVEVRENELSLSSLYIPIITNYHPLDPDYLLNWVVFSRIAPTPKLQLCFVKPKPTTETLVQFNQCQWTRIENIDWRKNIHSDRIKKKIRNFATIRISSSSDTFRALRVQSIIFVEEYENITFAKLFCSWVSDPVQP